MMNNKTAELLNTQVNKEFYSAYLYLALANYYHDNNLDGFANWYEIQAKEEMDHAMLMVKYLQNNDYSVTLEAIAKPEVKIESFKDPLNIALGHERYVTSLINTIYEAALETKDYRSQRFLDWFIDEQGEEEKNATDMIKRFELFGNDPKGLYALDSEYKSRTYSAPSLQLD